MTYNIQEQVDQECSETLTMSREQLKNLQTIYDKIATRLGDMAKSFEVYKDEE